MSREKIWKVEPHTLGKHDLLQGYLRAWFPILAQGKNSRVTFLDGFAGPGVYKDGQPGSPIIAVQTLVEHKSFNKLCDTYFEFIFVEERSDRFSSLKAELGRFWDRQPAGKPTNIGVVLQNHSFVDIARQLISSDHLQNDPVLAFVDPFGWSGVPMDTISTLLSSGQSEVLFNFAYDSVNRFVDDNRPEIARHFPSLFGTDREEHREARSLEGEKRKTYLHDLYLDQLKKRGGFRYVRSFELIDSKRGRTAYYLMFGTRHHKGLEVMKDAMWNLDPVSGRSFSGFAGDQQMLFEPEPDMAPLRSALVKRFDTTRVSINTIERFVVEDTDYKSTHYRRVLKELEIDGKIGCLNTKDKTLHVPSRCHHRVPLRGNRAAVLRWTVSDGTQRGQVRAPGPPT